MTDSLPDKKKLKEFITMNTVLYEVLDSLLQEEGEEEEGVEEKEEEDKEEEEGEKIKI